MTERLAHLLRDEADTLDLPPPDAGTAMSRGRGLRRRRRLFTGAATVAALTVVGGTALGVGALGGDDAKTDPATASVTGAVFSIGTTVYFDDGAQRAEIDDLAIKSLYYTSAGILVRHGENNWSDGGGPQRFSLVRPDGSVDPIDVVTEETVHSTDPTQPYLAYAEETDAGIEVVVRDLRDDTDAARVPIEGPFPADAWMPPAVSITGDQVYVGTSPTAYVVDWRSGDVTGTDAIDPGTMPNIFGGRVVSRTGGESTVVDVATGEVLLSVAAGRGGYFELSPDGRYAMIPAPGNGSGPRGGLSQFDVYDVDTGEHVTVPGQSYDYGWTAEDDVFTVTKSEVITCSPSSGECKTTAHGITMPPMTEATETCMTYDGREECYEVPGQDWRGTLRLGGQVFES
jgi:hypothetical protein